MDGGQRVVMQTVGELAGEFSLRQALTMGEIIVLGYVLDLLKQLGLAFCLEEHLGLSEVV